MEHPIPIPTPLPTPKPTATPAAPPGWTRRAALRMAIASVATAGSAARGDAGYPSRPITLIVPFAPAGIADLTARAVAQQMSATLKQTIVVDNRPSAGSIVGSSAVAHAPPDGYTLLLMSNGNAVSAKLFKKLPFDALRDFAPVATLGFFDLALFVGAESPFKSLREVVAQAKAKPGSLTIGTIAAGSTQNLAAELFKTAAGIDAVIVPYKGTPAVLTALRAREIDLGIEILGPMLPQVQAGVIRPLAITSAQRYADLPDVSTVREQGIAGYDVASWNALAVPAGTPKDVIDTLNRAAVAAVRAPAVVEQLRQLGVRPAGSTPQQTGALLASEIKRWGDVIRAAKIELQ